MTVIAFKCFGNGSVAYALGAIYGMPWPSVNVSESAPGSIVVECDVTVPMRDGVSLRVNVYRPLGERPSPVLLTHRYG